MWLCVKYIQDSVVASYRNLKVAYTKPCAIHTRYVGALSLELHRNYDKAVLFVQVLRFLVSVINLVIPLRLFGCVENRDRFFHHILNVHITYVAALIIFHLMPTLTVCICFHLKPTFS